MTTTDRAPLTLAEAQGIAEGIVGQVRWEGAQALCECPGKTSHTTANAATDCKVVCQPIGELAPGIYCFHSSCSDATAAASFALRSALGKRNPSSAPRNRSPFVMPTRPAPATFDPAKLERIARKLDGIDDEWFARRSAKCVWNRTPASFLHELYLPGEKVVIFDTFKSQGQHLWTHKAPPFDARELDTFRTGKPEGVWYLCNPVTGEAVPDGSTNKDGTPHLTRRSYRTVTSWRYLVLESDKADPAHWLAALAQMPLPISAIYTSGGASVHALIRMGTESKAHWDSIAAEIKPMLVTLGADPKAIKAVQLSRLPCCRREEKDAMQTLLYLNGNPDQTPLCEKGEL
jgi:hypothetical protein